MNNTKPEQGKEVKTGVVINALPNTTFKVLLDNNEGEVFTHLSGKMRLHHIKVLVGDRVKLEIDNYDRSKGRIVQRF